MLVPESVRLEFEEVTVGALASRAHRSCNNTSRTLASIAIEASVSLNYSLNQSICHSSVYQCPDGSISHWGGRSGSDRGSSGSGSFSWRHFL
ncbi:hypothetical protein Tco_1381086 [Tanacetum coccineum]